jgi:hypothetical protein
MAKIWRVVAMICVFLFILGAALIGVAYATGSSVGRLMATTDIMDMTKFFTREQLQEYLSMILPNV